MYACMHVCILLFMQYHPCLFVSCVVVVCLHSGMLLRYAWTHTAQRVPFLRQGRKQQTWQARVSHTVSASIDRLSRRLLASCLCSAIASETNDVSPARRAVQYVSLSRASQLVHMYTDASYLLRTRSSDAKATVQRAAPGHVGQRQDGMAGQGAWSGHRHRNTESGADHAYGGSEWYAAGQEAMDA